MKITVLGSGTSSGVPNIVHGFGDCDPHNPKNIRSRCSIFIESGATKLLVDTSPDLRQQLLQHNITSLSALLYTHDHADHCHGIDDLRPIALENLSNHKKPIPMYLSQPTFETINKKFGYVFRNTDPTLAAVYPPLYTPHIIDDKTFTYGDITITPFWQDHGLSKTLGFRFNDFAYSTDVKNLDPTAWQKLQGVKVWLVDALQIKPHITHSHFAQTLQWIEQLGVARAYLTHMNQFMDYATIANQCPPHVAPAYDGLVIKL